MNNGNSNELLVSKVSLHNTTVDDSIESVHTTQ